MTGTTRGGSREESRHSGFQQSDLQSEYCRYSSGWGDATESALAVQFDHVGNLAVSGSASKRLHNKWTVLNRNTKLYRPI